MKKSDLKAGYTLEDEKGRFWYLLPTKDGLSGVLINNCEIIKHNILAVDIALNDDLTLAKNSYNPSCNIVRVYGHPYHLSIILNGSIDGCDILWQREKPKKKVTLDLTDDQLEKIKAIINE